MVLPVLERCAPCAVLRQRRRRTAAGLLLLAGHRLEILLGVDESIRYHPEVHFIVGRNTTDENAITKHAVQTSKTHTLGEGPWDSVMTNGLDETGTAEREEGRARAYREVDGGPVRGASFEVARARVDRHKGDLRRENIYCV